MDLAAHIDHTLLKPTATPEEVAKAAEEALEYGFYGLCIPPSYVAWVKARYPHAPFRLVTVVGFPLGATTPDVKAYETRRAIVDGATEIDMVINVGALKSGDLRLVDCEDAAVAEITASRPLLRCYQRQLAAFIDGARDFCTRRGIAYVLTNTAVPVEVVITQYLRRRGLVP